MEFERGRDAEMDMERGFEGTIEERNLEWETVVRQRVS